jgi:Fur family zinc uptake transcriptional regulator
MTFEDFTQTLNYNTTDLRKDILYILWHAKAPLKAYDILDELKKTRGNARPPTVYRVLDFLLEQNTIHRLDNTQSYVLCHSHDKHEIGKQVIMLCNTCNSTIELSNPIMQTLVHELAKSQHFHLNTHIIELTGQCKKCYH